MKVKPTKVEVNLDALIKGYLRKHKNPPDSLKLWRLAVYEALLGLFPGDVKYYKKGMLIKYVEAIMRQAQKATGCSIKVIRSTIREVKTYTHEKLQFYICNFILAVEEMQVWKGCYGRK